MTTTVGQFFDQLQQAKLSVVPAGARCFEDGVEVDADCYLLETTFATNEDMQAARTKLNKLARLEGKRLQTRETVQPLRLQFRLG